MNNRFNKRLALMLVLIPVLMLFVACGNKDVINHNLFVQVQGEGTVFPNSGAFPKGQTISFIVNPSYGWIFDQWSGRDASQVVSNGGRFEILVNADISLLAIFKKIDDGGGNYYNLTVNTVGGGRVEQSLLSEAAALEQYPANSTVSLTAIANQGWIFKEWSGDASGNNSMTNVRMDRDKIITAVFSQMEKNLNIRILGQGRVDQRLLQDAQAEESYPGGSLVRLTAVAANGWIFQEWRGDISVKEPIATVEMDSDKDITAVFVEENKTLEIIIKGEGRVEKKLISDSEDYPAGSAIRLWARPADGWKFSGWRGDATGKNEIVYVALDTDMQVTAIFEEDAYNLEIEIIGNGRVDEKIINAFAGESYPIGAIVRLTAKPDKGWLFKEWGGDAKGNKETFEIEMDSNKLVTAEFTKEADARFKIELDVTGNGRVELDPDSRDYKFGTEVTLTAVADNGWKLKEWRGDASGTTREIIITMDSNKEIEAVFEERPTSGTGEVSGSIKLVHTWPNPYTKSNNLTTPRANIGKIPAVTSINKSDRLDPKEDYVLGELIVGIEEFRLQSAEEQVSYLEALGLDVNIAKSLPDINAYVINTSFDRQEMMEKIDELNSLENSCIAYVEPNYYYHILSNDNIKLPNDPMYSQQWHYRQLRLPHAWSVTTGSKSVRVAVLDTGINDDHEDLSGQVDTSVGWNFNANNNNFRDGHGHGSHCAGTIAAATNNNKGVAGVMWECSLLPIKVMSDQGRGSATDIANGILYVAGQLSSKPISNKAHIISMSLGGAGSIAQRNACEAAANAGLLIFGSAGNDDGPIGAPAVYPCVVAVGSTNYNYPNVPEKAWYSSFGPELDIMTPGGDTRADTDNDGNPDGVLSTTTNSKYEYYQGTSMACPHAAGIAGLMLASGIPAGEVRQVMRNTAMDIGGGDFSNRYGYGLVNVYWAVSNVKEIKIVVGTKEGNRIDAVAEGKVDLRAKQYTISQIPAGEYQVFGWIDVQDTDTLDCGDYLFESEVLTFEDGKKLSVNMELKELQ